MLFLGVLHGVTRYARYANIADGYPIPIVPQNSMTHDARLAKEADLYPVALGPTAHHSEAHEAKKREDHKHNDERREYDHTCVDIPTLLTRAQALRCQQRQDTASTER